MTDTAAARWAQDLAGWAIPERILAQAEQSPWIHPVELFRAGAAEPDSPSHRVARQALPDAGTVLDVGCGGGRAAFALVPPAGEVIGVDRRPEMLAEFAAQADRLMVRHTELLGDWPQLADPSPEAGLPPGAAQATAVVRVPMADVVTCHHVAYNVPELGRFALALTRHARGRVVLELPDRHPLASMAPLWQRFWGLERPHGPTADDAVSVLREAGLDPRVEYWSQPPQERPIAAVSPADQARFMRIRLCLPAHRDDEVATALAELGPAQARRLATVWWEP